MSIWQSIRKMVKCWALLVVFLQEGSGDVFEAKMSTATCLFMAYFPPPIPSRSALCVEGENVLPCRDHANNHEQ